MGSWVLIYVFVVTWVTRKFKLRVGEFFGGLITSVEPLISMN